MIVRKLITLLGFDMDDAGAEAYEKRMASIQRGMAIGGAALSAAITAPVVTFLTGAMKTSGDFESQMTELAVTSGGTTEQLERLRAKTRQLGKDMTYSAGEVAGGAGELVKAGVSIEDVTNGVLKSTLDLAGASRVSVGSSSGLLARVMTTFKVKAADAAEVANDLLGLSNSTSWGFEDVNQAVANFGGLGAALGMSVEEMTNLLAAISGGGFATGADAATSLKSAMMGLMNPSKANAKLMKKYGVSMVNANGTMKTTAELTDNLREAMAGMSEVQAAQFAAQIGGTDGVRAILALRGTTKEQIEANRASIEAADAAKINAAQMAGWNGAVQQLSGAFDDLKIAIADAGLMDWAKQAIAGFTDFVDAVGTLDKPTLKLMTIFALVAAAAGPLLLGVAGLAALVGSTGLLATVLVALGVAAGVAAGVDLANWANGADSAFEKFAGSAKDATGSLRTMRDGILGMGTAWDKMTSAGTSAWGRIGAAMELYGSYTEAFLGGIFAGVSALASEAFVATRDAGIASWQAIKSGAMVAWDALMDYLQIDMTPQWIKNIGGWFSSIGSFFGAGGSGPAPSGPYNGSRSSEVPFSGQLVGAAGALDGARSALPGGGPITPSAARSTNITTGPMTVNITAQPGTTQEQARGINEQFSKLFDQHLGRAARGAAYDFPTAEAPL